VGIAVVVRWLWKPRPRQASQFIATAMIAGVRNDLTFFNTGFMDTPESYPPQYHSFAGQQISWLELNDDLPRHEKTLLIETK